jgi:hypothetical protein
MRFTRHEAAAGRCAQHIYTRCEMHAALLGLTLVTPGKNPVATVPDGGDRRRVACPSVLGAPRRARGALCQAIRLSSRRPN